MESLFNMVYYPADLLKTAVSIFLVALMFELVFNIVAIIKAGIRSI